MKNKENRQTKYYKRYFDEDSLEFGIEEIELNSDNWFYVQIDASIKYAFNKYGFKCPKYCIIEELAHYVIFYVYRDDIKTENELLQWHNKCQYVLDELKHVAECNSKDEIEDPMNWVKYEFRTL